jgi:hypothetical protein
MRDFSGHIQTQQFIAWLSARIDGSARLDFKHADGNFATLSDARDAYQWPPKRKTVPTPIGDLELEANASLTANQRVLDRLGQGLRDCLAVPAIDEVLLAQWIKAVLVWGGVYTRHRNGGGNAGWLDARVQAEDLAVNLRAALATLTDDSVHFDRGPADLRSNAGLTKVYSLVLDDFIIYDSRVAAALAWLVMIWGREVGGVPDHLKFACMRARKNNSKGKTSKPMKLRSPGTEDFPYFSPSVQQRSHWRHAVWNLRANHVLAEALAQACRRRPDLAAAGFQTVRDVEAALFVMGADLRHALG